MPDKRESLAKMHAIRGLIEDVADATLRAISIKSLDRMVNLTSDGDIVGVWGLHLSRYQIETVETASIRLQRQATSFPSLSKVLTICDGLETDRPRALGAFCEQCHSEKMGEGTPGIRHVAIQDPVKKRVHAFVCACDCPRGQRMIGKNMNSWRSHLDAVWDRQAKNPDIRIYVTGSDRRMFREDGHQRSIYFYRLRPEEREGSWTETRRRAFGAISRPIKHTDPRGFLALVESGPEALQAFMSEPQRPDPHPEDL